MPSTLITHRKPGTSRMAEHCVLISSSTALLDSSVHPWSFSSRSSNAAFTSLSCVILIACPVLQPKREIHLGLRELGFSWHFRLHDFLVSRLCNFGTTRLRGAAFPFFIFPCRLRLDRYFQVSKSQGKGRGPTGAYQLSFSRRVFCKSPNHSQASRVSG